MSRPATISQFDDATTASIGKAIQSNVETFRSRSRNPMFTYYAAIHLLKNRDYLNRMMEYALSQSPRDTHLITSVKEKITQNETAIGLCPIMTADVREIAQTLLDQVAPITDQNDPSTAVSKDGALDGEQLRKKIQRNTQRVKINGKLITGTANAITSYVDAMQAGQRDLQDAQIQSLVNRESNDLRHRIEQTEEQEREEEVYDEEQHVENDEQFAEVYQEAIDALELEELTAEQAEPGVDDDLWSDIGLYHTAEERGLDLACDAESARIETEREAALICLQHEFNAGDMSVEELKNAIQNAERSYHKDSQRLARAYTVLKDPEARAAWEKKFGNSENVPKGPEHNPALTPRSASDVKQSINEFTRIMEGQLSTDTPQPSN